MDSRGKQTFARMEHLYGVEADAPELHIDRECFCQCVTDGRYLSGVRLGSSPSSFVLHFFRNKMFLRVSLKLFLELLSDSGLKRRLTFRLCLLSFSSFLMQHFQDYCDQ